MAVVIADLLPEPVKIELGRGTVEVHGLPMEEVVPLVMAHKDELAPFFKGDEPDMAGLILSAPKVAASIIAAGIDAPGQEDAIRKMPMALQIECLLSVWHQTVPDVKKLRESLLTVMASISLNPEKVTTDLSQTGTESTLPKLSSTSSDKDTASQKSASTPPAS